MIHKIEINDSSLSPFPYIDTARSDVFNLSPSYKFTKGVNVVVGANGSGKSTLLNIIRKYTLCDKHYHSIFSQLLHTLKLFTTDMEFLGGIDVYSNYGCSTFNLRGIDENKDNFNLRGYSIDDFVEYVNSTNLSKGNVNLLTLENLFKKMFDNPPSLIFPIKDIQNKINNLSDGHPWCSALTSLLQYYSSNNIPDSVVAVLMDEPEQNLDLYNTSSLYDILTHDRGDTQIITSIHNPLLIYKLYKLSQLGETSNINFIELTDNYLNDIMHFVEGDELETRGGSGKGDVNRISTEDRLQSKYDELPLKDKGLTWM